MKCKTDTSSLRTVLKQYCDWCCEPFASRKRFQFCCVDCRDLWLAARVKRPRHINYLLINESP